MKKRFKKLLALTTALCVAAVSFTAMSPASLADDSSKVKSVPTKYKGSPVISEEATVACESDEESGGTAETRFYFSEGYFKNCPSSYNSHLSSMSMVMAMTAMFRKPRYAIDFFEKLDCDDISPNEGFLTTPAENSVGIVAASRTLYEGSKNECTLVPVVIRGGGYGNEGISNFNIGEYGDSAGFLNAAEQVKAYVISYMDEHDIDEDEVKILISGYSRGGSIANIAGKLLSDEIGKRHVYGYSFEPAMAADTSLCSQKVKKYTNLHSVTNYNDGVTRIIPEYMNFTYYGTSHCIARDKGNCLFKLKEKKMLRQLEDISETAASTYKSPAEFTWARIPLSYRDILAFLFGEKKEIFVNVDTRHRYGNSQRECMDLTLKRISNAIPDRTVYSKTINKNISEAAESIGMDDPYTVEEAVRQGILFSGSITEEQSRELSADLKNVNYKSAENVLTLKHVRDYLVYAEGDYSDVVESLWKLLDTKDGKFVPVSDILTDDQTEQFKGLLSTMLYTFSGYISVDYNRGRQTLGAVLYNMNTISQAHHPEVNFAWVRLNDCYYSTN